MDLQILVIEDDALLRKGIFDRLSSWGHQVVACDSLAGATENIEKTQFDLVLTDMCLPDGNSLDFIGEIKKTTPELEWVVMTAFADVKTAVAAIRAGAYDYLPKPFEDAQLEKIVRNFSEKRTLTQQVFTLSRLKIGGYDEMTQFGEMIGSATMGKVFDQAQRVARMPDTTVLILGESGSGKGMLAKAIHRNSPRASKPFVDINCAAIPAQLMESELFGYEKGAFTDAKNRKPGLFEVAQGGTIFLDEIGDMDVNLQGKLLKVLEDKEFRRLGSGKTTRVDVRIIAATNRDLKERVKDGQFREDLYYRLSVIPLTIPPLREHRESIGPLAQCYLEFYCKQMARQIKGFTAEASRVMQAYGWPGNVRELRNVVERCVVLAQGDEIRAEDMCLTLSPDVRSAVSRSCATEASASAAPVAAPEAVSSGVTEIMSLADSEKRLIEAVLKSAGGNKNRAAEILKIHRTTLYKKIEEYGLAAEA